MHSIRSRRLFRGLSLAFILGVSSNLAVANPPAGASGTGLRLLLGMGLTFGGETLVNVRYTDGSTTKVSSGGLVNLFAGAEYEWHSAVLQATVGYHVDDANASNGSVKFARYPLELLALWKASDHWRLGGGLRSAESASVSTSGAARSSVVNADFGSKLGYVLQAEYVVGGMSGRGSYYLRLVSEDYTVGRSTVDGGHAGFGFAFRF